MSGALALLWFVLALASLVAAGWGMSVVVAARRLDGRLGRMVTPVGPDTRGIRITGLFAARGRDQAEIREKLREAGFQGDDVMERFLWLRLAATLAAVLLALFASRIIWGDFFHQPFLLVVGGGVAYLLSKRALVLFAAARQRAITAEFPFLLDLMLMMLESGISLDRCFRAIAREETNAAPHLTQSVQGLVADLDRGMSYEDALDRWSSRLGIVGGRELGSLFQQALFQGIELSPALREFRREFTERRVAAARETMGRVTVQLVVVMMLFFMPALFIVIGGPPVAGLFETIRSLER